MFLQKCYHLLLTSFGGKLQGCRAGVGLCIDISPFTQKEFDYFRVTPPGSQNQGCHAVLGAGIDIRIPKPPPTSSATFPDLSGHTGLTRSITCPPFERARKSALIGEAQ